MKTVKITFRWVFCSENGRGSELRAEIAQEKGWPLWFEKIGGKMTRLGSTIPAPIWVQEGMKLALANPTFRDWRPNGRLGKEGYWVGVDHQKSPELKVEVEMA